MSEKYTYDIDELLGKYFLGEALPEEAMFVDEWKNMNETNRKYFDDAALLVGFATHTHQVTHLYQSIRNQIHQQERSRKIKLQRSAWWAVAASIVVLATIGYLFSMGKSSSKPDEYIVATNVTQKSLVDGSLVTLNKHAKLTVKGGFNKKERRVVLKGEAYFEVVHNTEVPFVIECEGLEITDIGTAFNIKSTPNSDTVFIAVTEGVVEVKQAEQKLQLGQGQSVVYRKSTHQFYTPNQTINSNVTAYKTKHFHFEETSLAEVINTLNAVYGEVFVLGDENLGKCLISVDFRNELPDTIVLIITETLGLSYTKQQHKFVITGQSCVY